MVPTTHVAESAESFVKQSAFASNVVGLFRWAAIISIPAAAYVNVMEFPRISVQRPVTRASTVRD